LLLAKGGDIEAKDSETGATPLHMAASWGRREVLELLLSKGANPNSRNKSGLTVLGVAVQSEQQDIAAFLRSKGAQP
jgi:ankyrin repeat protein